MFLDRKKPWRIKVHHKPSWSLRDVKVIVRKWKKEIKKNVSLYLFTSYFAYYYETYRQIRKTPRLQSAQISFNNWILCTPWSLPAHPSIPTRNWAPPRGKKKTAPRPFFKFQLPPDSQELYSCIDQSSKFTSAVGNYQGFCQGKQCFYSNHAVKNIAKVIIS